MSADIELKWEWPAEREVTDRLLIKVDNVKAKGTGLFGIGGSPSLAENIPDPVVIFGTVQKGSQFTDGKSLMVVAPKLEVEAIKKGAYAVLGIVEKDICICVVPIESSEVDIATVNCQP